MKHALAAATLVAALVGGALPVAAQPRTGTRLTTVDVEPSGDGPLGLAVTRQRGRSYVVVADHLSNEVRSFSLDRSGDLSPAGAAQAGHGPTAVAVSRRGYVLVTNAYSNDVTVFRMDRRGGLNRVGSTPAGTTPNAIAIDRRDFVLVTSRDTDEVIAYHLDRRGGLTETDRAGTGNQPSSVAVSRHGLVAVTNAASSDVSGFFLHPRDGRLILLASSVPVGDFPRAAAFSADGREAYCVTGLGQPGAQDQVHALTFNGRQRPIHDTIDAGYAISSLAVGRRHVFVGSATAAGEDQVLALRSRRGRLTLDGGERLGTGYTFKTLAVAREGRHEFVLVTEPDRDTTRSLRVD